MTTQFKSTIHFFAYHYTVSVSNMTTSTREGKNMKCNRTFVKEQYKVSLCSILHVQGYGGPAWTHTALVLSASRLIQC